MSSNQEEVPYETRFEIAAFAIGEEAKNEEDFIRRLVDRGFDHCPCGRNSCGLGRKIKAEVERRGGNGKDHSPAGIQISAQEITMAIQMGIREGLSQGRKAQVEIIVAALEKYRESSLSYRAWKVISWPFKAFLTTLKISLAILLAVFALVLYPIVVLAKFRSGMLQWEKGKRRFEQSPEMQEFVQMINPIDRPTRWGIRLGIWYHEFPGKFAAWRKEKTEAIRRRLGKKKSTA